MTKEMTKKEENLPSGISQDVLEKLKQGSGEGDGPKYTFIPQIEVDNSTEVKNVDGEEIEVLCKPRWKITSMENQEKVVKPYHESFGGIILVIKYQVMKSYEPKEKQTLPFFYSNEFSAGVFNSNQLIDIKFEDEERTYTYKEFKAEFAGKYTLYANVYVWTDNSVKKVRLKKSNLSALWDYLKNFKGNDSVTVHPTVFGTIRKKEPKPYNTSEFKVAKEYPEIDWEHILKVQEEINAFFKPSQSQEIINKMGGEEVLEVNEDEEDIKVDEIPF